METSIPENDKKESKWISDSRTNWRESRKLYFAYFHIFTPDMGEWRIAELNFRHFGRYWLPIEIERTSWNSIRESRITELKPLIFKLTIAIAYSSESIRNKWLVLSRTSTARYRTNTKCNFPAKVKNALGKLWQNALYVLSQPPRKTEKIGNKTLNEYAIYQ